MDNEGGLGIDPGMGGDPNGGPAFDGGDLGAGQDENVDQYFDDGGETFLPADHVSSSSTSCLPSCRALDTFVMKMIQIVTAMLWFILTAAHGPFAKRSHEAIDGRARARGSQAERS